MKKKLYSPVREFIKIQDLNDTENKLSETQRNYKSDIKSLGQKISEIKKEIKERIEKLKLR